MRFGDYFKNLRISKNITQKQIADAIGKNPMLVSNVENNKSGPFVEADLIKIAKYLCLNDDENQRLFIEATKENGKLPMHVLEYCVQFDKALVLMEIIAKKHLDNASLSELIAWIEEKFE